MTTPGAAGEVVITSTVKAMADEMARELPRAARSVEEFEARINSAGGQDRFAEQITAQLTQLTRATQDELRKQAELRANAAREFRSTGRLDVPGGQSFSAAGKSELSGLGTGITAYAQAIEKAYGPAAARLVEAEGAKAMRAALQTQLNLTKNLEAVQKVTQAPATSLVGYSNVAKVVADAESKLARIGRTADEIARLPAPSGSTPRPTQASVDEAFRRRQAYTDPQGNDKPLSQVVAERQQSGAFFKNGTQPLDADINTLHTALKTAAKTTGEMFRGAGSTSEELAQLKAGAKISLPLSSFSSAEHVAERFSRQGDENVLYHLAPGAKALEAPGGPGVNDFNFDGERETLTAGHFRVLRVEYDQEEELYRVHIEALRNQLARGREAGGAGGGQPPKPPVGGAAAADDGGEEVRYSRAELAQKTREAAEQAARATAEKAAADRKLEQEILLLAEERGRERAEAAAKRGVKVATNIPLDEATRLVDRNMGGRVGSGGNAPFALPGYDRTYFDVVRPKATQENPFPGAPYVTPVDDRSRIQQLELQRTTQERVAQTELAAYRQREADAERVEVAARRLGQTQLRAIAEDDARTRVSSAQALDRRLATQLQTPHADDPSRMQATQIGGPSSNLYRTLEGDYVKRTALGAEIVQGDTNLLSATRRYTEQVNKQEQSSRGFFSGVLSGATSRGLNSTAGGTNGLSDLLDGDNRKRILGNLGSTAGNAIRYSAAYATLGIGTGIISSEAAAIRDYTDSLTDLQVAFGETNKVSQEFIGQLGEIARISGSNVAEAMDSAARGVRAFGDETKAGDEAAGQAVAKVSAQLALITGGKLKDKTGDLIAAASAYNVAPANQGQILDAVAYAKKFQGDPNQISQGLANFGSVGASAGFNSLQSASLVSLVSGRNDETGQAAATRLSKILATIQGQSAQGTLTGLGIDTSGTPAAVLEKTIDAYGRLGKAQQQQLLIAVGGTAQQRETTALFAQGGAVLKATADATVALGAGEDEAKRRGDDLVGLLKKLSADIKGVETGLGATDIFAPIIIGLKLLEPALHILDSFINLIDRLDDLLTKTLPLPSFLPANLITGLAFDALVIRRIMKSIRADRDAALAENGAGSTSLLGRTRARLGTAVGGAGVQRSATAAATTGAVEADAAAATTTDAAATSSETASAADSRLTAARKARVAATTTATAAEERLVAITGDAAGASGTLARAEANVARLDAEVGAASTQLGQALLAQNALMADAAASAEALAAAEANVVIADNAVVRATALWTGALEELAYAQNTALNTTSAQAAATAEASSASTIRTLRIHAETRALQEHNVEQERTYAAAGRRAALETRTVANSRNAARTSIAADADAVAAQRLAAATAAEQAATANLLPFTERANAAHVESARVRQQAAIAALLQEKAEQELAASQGAIAASSREMAAAQAELTSARTAEAAASTRVARAGFQGQAFAAVAAGYTPTSGKDEAKLQRALAAETDLQVAQERGAAAEGRIAAAEESRTAALARETAAVEALTLATAALDVATEKATAAQAEYDAVVAANNTAGMAAADQAATAAKIELASATTAAAAAQTELNAAQASMGATSLLNLLGPLGVSRRGALPGPSGLSNEAKSALAGNLPVGASKEFEQEVARLKGSYLEELKQRNLGSLTMKQAFQRSTGIIETGAVGTGNALSRLGTNLALGAAGLGNSLKNFLTSGLGMTLLGIGGALAAIASYDAGKRVLKQSNDSDFQVSQVSTLGTTDVAAIQKQSADLRTLASNDLKASGGFFGSVTNALYGHVTESAAAAANKVADQYDILARRVKKITDEAIKPGIAGDKTLAFDLNKSTGVADGLKKLADSGYSAQVQFDALLGSIDKLTQGAHDATGALDQNRLKLYSANVATDIGGALAGGGSGVGRRNPIEAFADSIVAPLQNGINNITGHHLGHGDVGNHSNEYEDQKALAKIDTGKANTDIQRLINQSGLDPTTPEGLKAIQDLVRKYLEKLLPGLHDKGLRERLIQSAVDSVATDVDKTFTLTDPGNTLQQIEQNAPDAGAKAAARTGLLASVGLGPTDPTTGKKLSPGLAQAQAAAKNAKDALDRGVDILQGQADDRGPKGKTITQDDPRLAPLLENYQTQQAALESAAYKDIDNRAKVADAIATPFDETGALARRQKVLDQKVAAAQNPDDIGQNTADQAILDRDKLTQSLKAKQSARIAALDPRDTAGLADAKEKGDKEQLERIKAELTAAGVKDFTTSDAYNEAVALVNQDHISSLQTALDKETAIALASNDSRDTIADLTTQITELTKQGGQLDIDKGDPVALAKDGQHKDDLNRRLEQYKKERVDATNALKIDPGDLLGNDQQSINEAQTALDGALQFDKDGEVSLDYQKKQKALDNAKLKLAQDQVSAGDAQARALIPAGDDVASATQDVADAQHALDKLTKGNADFAAAQRTLADKQRDLAQAQLTRSEAIVTEGIDRTDPVKVAKNNLSIAQQQLEFDKKHGAGEDKLRTDRISVKDLSNAAEDAQFQQNLSDAQTKERLQQSTHAQYLQYLKSEHDRLTAIKDKTRQQQDELNQIDGLIKDANSSLAGQFNLGDIKLPSVYEVRRSLKQDAIAGNASAANSTVVNNVISINGADTAEVKRVITGLLGPSAIRRTPTAAGAKL